MARPGAQRKASAPADPPGTVDPQARDLPIDSHLHTDASTDSSVPIDVYAAQAVDRRIPEILITDHLDFDPRAPNHAPDVARRERVVREAAERWAAEGLTIRFGVEISYERQREQEIRDHLARTPYDYAIGSVHVGSDSPYGLGSIPRWVAARSLAEIVEPYFAEVTAAARSGLFDVIGHLDYVKRYLHPHVRAADLAGAPELYEPVLRALVESGSGLEVNTSGLRQAPRETYPSAATVRRFRELGGERVTTGSDAHRPDWFAWGLEAGYEIVSSAGFRTLRPWRAGQRQIELERSDRPPPGPNRPASPSL